jgi:uncharacterized membrane protein (DUF373 family)
MLRHLKRFERLIAWILAVLLISVILLATVDLAVNIVKALVFVAPRFLIGVDQLLDIFGMFLIVVLGLELLETVRAYLQDDLIHVEVVLIVAIIALARKVIILELKDPTPLTLFGVAALIISLGASYRLIMHVLLSTSNSSVEKKQ